jgi:hypothetical protein
MAHRCAFSCALSSKSVAAPLGDRWVESTSLQRRVSTKYLQLELALPAFRAWRGAPELIPFAVAIARSALAAKAGPR